MTQKLISFVSFDEYQKLHRAARDDKELRFAMALGFGAGLRISEIVGFKRKVGDAIPPLSPGMVNLATHQIRIEDAKGKKWRITVTPANITEEMIKLLPLKIPRRTLQHRFSELTQKVLGKKLHFHCLRHGFGNYQANVLKVPLPIVQQMMGHSRLDTTGIYTKANPEYAIGIAWKAMTGQS